MSFRIPWAKPMFTDRERRHVIEALESTWISGGPYVDRLEREFTAHHGAPYGIAVSNGTTALQVALLALGVGPGDEVIVPGYCFVAPGNMVIACGAQPVFVDIEADTWSVDVDAVATAITPRTRAIIAVHNYGNVCDLTALRHVCDRAGVALVEDVAESAFSKRDGQFAGTVGDLGCFSFQATKTITTGEGGFVLTPRQDLYDKMRTIRDHGMRRGKRYWHDEVGFNFRLTNLQAALGCAQLEVLDQIIAERGRVWRGYQSQLGGVAGVALQHFQPGVEPVMWAVALRLDERQFGARDGVIDKLAAAGIETRPGFYPFHVMPLYQRYGARPLAVAEEVGARVISVPTFPALTDEEIADVCTHLRELAT
ncbi:MAG: arnB [Myxococcales bacterium]|nr:arnB [Myxococcales bacterium]